MVQRFKNFFLHNSNPRQTIVKNVFWLLVTQCSRLLRIAVLLYAARALGTAEYGIFSYILSLVAIFSIFSDMGINGLLIRDTANRPERRQEYFATSFWIKISLIAGTALALWIIAPHVTNIKEALYLIPIAGLLILFDTVRDFIIAYMRGLEQMERETLIVAILNVTLALFGFTALFLDPTARALFLMYTASSAVATLVAIYLIRKKVSHLLSSFKKSIAREICRDGWPIAIAGAFGMIMLNVDIIMLGIWNSATDIGLYAAGQKIIQVLYSIPALISIAVFPVIASIIKRGNKEQERSINERTFTSVFLFTIPLIVGGIILAKPIFAFVFGADYVGGAGAFVILLINVFFLFPGTIIANLVLAHNQQATMFKFVIIASLVNVLLNILLIPRMGIVGAALATLCAQAINYGCTWWKLQQTTSFTLFGHLKKILISSLCMGIICFLLARTSIHVMYTILLAGCIYFGMLFLLKENILSELRSLIKNLGSSGQETVR